MRHVVPRKALALIVAVGALIALASPVAAVAAPTDESDASDVLFLEENMARFAVPQDLRASLLEKALSGVPVDADVPGAVPIATDTVTNEYGTFPVNRYADGSFESTGVAPEVIPAEGGASVMEIKNCSVSGGSTTATYTGCQVYHWTLGLNMWFPVSYTTASGFGRVDSMPYSGRGLESTQACQDQYYNYTNTSNTGSALWEVSCVDYVGGTTYNQLRLHVSGGGATTSWDY